MSSQTPTSSTEQRPKGRRSEKDARTGKRKASETHSAGLVPREESMLSPASSSKVAIPRLRPETINEHDARAREGAKLDRTIHACEPCRTRKTKCSGERPTCKHCRQFNIACVYADGKRDRIKREQERTERKLALYKALLIEAGPDIGANIWSRFQKARSPSRETGSDREDSLEKTYGHIETARAEYQRAASDKSMNAVDSVQENVTRNAESQSTGFLGKASDVEWQKGINEKEDAMSDERHRRHPSGTGERPIKPSSSNMSYQIPHAPLPGLEHPGLDIHAVPPKEIASYLSNTFFRVVYPSFPLLSKHNFEMQLSRAYYGNFEKGAQPNVRWRAIMNLIMAIATQYLQITKLELPQNHDSHEVFFARSARLGLVSQSLLESTDLQQIQIYGLSALYLTAASHMNRAWTLVGLAVRGAVALGLHLEIKTDDLDEFAREARYRLWWSVYSLDNMLQVVTGRPAAISLSGFSTPLPVPYDEDQFRPQGEGPANMSRFTQASWRRGRVPAGSRAPNIDTDAPLSSRQAEGTPQTQPLSNVRVSGSLYFIFRLRLSLIVHEIIEALYQPASAHLVWSQVQSGIDRLYRSLEEWLSQLPPELDFRNDQQSDSWSVCREHLGFLYYTAAIIANRPCLREMVVEPTEEANESKDFNANSARICVESAICLLRLLPPDFEASRAALKTPWWAIVHHLFSAVTVLTISLFYECRHVHEEERPTVVQSAKDGLRWLQLLGDEGNEGAQRAWLIASTTFIRIASRMGVDVSDVRPPIAAYKESVSQEMRSAAHGNAGTSALPTQSHHSDSSMPVADSRYPQFMNYDPIGMTDIGCGPFFGAYVPPMELDLGREFDMSQVSDTFMSSEMPASQSSSLDFYTSRQLPSEMMNAYAAADSNITSSPVRSSVSVSMHDHPMQDSNNWQMQSNAPTQQGTSEDADHHPATSFGSSDFRQ